MCVCVCVCVCVSSANIPSLFPPWERNEQKCTLSFSPSCFLLFSWLLRHWWFLLPMPSSLLSRKHTYHHHRLHTCLSPMISDVMQTEPPWEDWWHIHSESKLQAQLLPQRPRFKKQSIKCPLCTLLVHRARFKKQSIKSPFKLRIPVLFTNSTFWSHELKRVIICSCNIYHIYTSLVRWEF